MTYNSEKLLFIDFDGLSVLKISNLHDIHKINVGVPYSNKMDNEQ